MVDFTPVPKKYALLSSHPANPFVVRPGQFDVPLTVGQRRVAQLFLQHGNRNTPQHAVAAVGVPEGVRVGPGGAEPDLACCVLHRLALRAGGESATVANYCCVSLCLAG